MQTKLTDAYGFHVKVGHMIIGRPPQLTKRDSIRERPSVFATLTNEQHYDASRQQKKENSINVNVFLLASSEIEANLRSFKPGSEWISWSLNLKLSIADHRAQPMNARKQNDKSVWLLNDAGTN